MLRVEGHQATNLPWAEDADSINILVHQAVVSLVDGEFEIRVPETSRIFIKPTPAATTPSLAPPPPAPPAHLPPSMESSDPKRKKKE